MAIADDISVAVNGDIRYTGSGTTYTVLELHRFLQDLADEETASGDDLLHIIDDTPSERSTDNIITLVNGYQIDSVLAEYLYDGSVSQGTGVTEEVFSGLVVVGSVETGTELQIIQNDTVLKNFWGTGINVDAANNIIMRILVKTREFGVDIDGRRLRVQARELGDSYGEFSLQAGLGNNTAAIFTNADLNNATIESTIAGWTTVSNTEGLRLLDVDGDTVDEEYYSEWDLGSQTINDLYERTKWLQKRALAEDSNAETGNDFIVGNGTSTGQAQAFAVGGNATRLVRARFKLKKVLAPTGALTFVLYAHSGTFGVSSIPTGAALATSEEFEVADLTTAYQEIELRFIGDQSVEMTASTSYVIAVEYTGGDASNYVDVEGDTTGTHAGNQSDEAAATWTPAAAEDLWFEVYSSSTLQGRPGELHRGPTHSFPYNTEVGGPFTENEILAYGTTFAYDTESGGPFVVGEILRFSNSGSIGVLLQLTDNGADGTMVVAIQPGSGTVVDPDTITGDTSTATAEVNGAVAGAAAVGGTAILLALDDDGTVGNFFVQVLTGVAPVDTLLLTGITSLATALVNGVPVARTISPSFIGASTGSAIIGSYGIGIEPADLTASDQLFDLSNSLVLPPNNVTFTVFGLEVGEDRVLVGPEALGVLEVDQLTLLTTLSGGTETAVVLTSAIPTDTPTTGTIRIQLDSGVYRRIAYLSYTGSTFTIASTSFVADPATNPRNVFISYIDKLAGAVSEAFTGVYLADRALFIRVRDGGVSPIKTFETTGTLTNAGGSTTAIRTTDA